MASGEERGALVMEEGGVPVVAADWGARVTVAVGDHLVWGAVAVAEAGGGGAEPGEGMELGGEAANQARPAAHSPTPGAAACYPTSC